MQITPAYSGRMGYNIVGDDGNNYVFVPKEFAQKGFTLDGNQWYSDAFLQPGAFDKASTFTLPDSSALTEQAKALYKEPTQGYIWKAEDFAPLNKNDFTFNSYAITDAHPALAGLGKIDGQTVYSVTKPEEGWQQTYANLKDGALNFHSDKVTPGRSLLGDIFGGIGDTVAGVVNGGFDALQGLGPLGVAAISALSPTAGAAIAGANTGKALASGADLGQVATGLGAAYLGSQLGSTVGAETGSNALGAAAGTTTSGLLSGQNLETALTGGAFSGAGTGIAGGINSAASSTANKDYTSGADYSAPSSGGGLGIKTSMGSGTELFGNNSGSDGLNSSSALNGTFNLGSMGGGQGVTIPSATGTGTLGASGSGNVWGTTSNQVSPLDQNNNILSNGMGNTVSAGTITSLLKTLFGGTSGTGNTNMATDTSTTNNQALGSLLGGLLGGAGGLMQSSTNNAAMKGYANAITQAGQQAQNQAAFRPVGTTTTFGTSNFQFDPTTGQLTNAGYSLSPQAQAMQDQLMAGNRQSLTDAATLQNLGRGYLAQDPNQVAQNWMSQQQALLRPANEQALAGVQNRLAQTGRTGLSVAQGGNLGAANPEMQAYYNALAQQNAGLAAQAQQQGQNQVTFGQGLLSNAYNPFTAGLTASKTVEGLGQQPLGLSTDLAKLTQSAGYQQGALGLKSADAAAQAMQKANTYNPYASVLSNLGTSTTAGNVLGGLLGNTSIGSSLGSWIGSLGNNNNTDWFTGSDVSPTSTFNGGWADTLTPEEKALYGL